MSCRIPGIPCNTTATHPAAPLGSRRRSAPPLSFATRNLQKWQEVNEDELRDENFTSNFQSPFRRGALKVGFKQKLVARVTRVAHVPRWSKIQARSPAPCWLQGYLQARSTQSNFQSPFRRGALKVTFKQKLVSRAIPPPPIAQLYISPFLHGQNPELFLQRHAMLI